MDGLSPTTIRQLYEHALDAPGPKTWWITRLAMYKALHRALSEYDGNEKTCLSISGSKGLGVELGLTKTKYTEVSYPDANFIDLPFESGTFDFCVSDQVLEHVEGDPQKAFSESIRVVKPGGYVCHTTCFVNGIHAAPKDFWRFTPESLRLLSDKANAESIACGGWGNREVIGLMASPLRMKPIPDDPANPIYQLALRNEPSWPIVVWIISRRH
jgi:SAM-dependent methyltransferase